MNTLLPRTIRIKFITILATGIVACMAFAMGPVAHADDITTALSNTQNTLQKIADIKDSTTMSDQEKASLELQLKESVLTDVITISQQQITDIETKLNAISFPTTDAWKTAHDALIAKLTNAYTYFDNLKQTLATSTQTLDDIKTLAQTIEQQKTTIFDPVLKQAQDVIAIFNISDILTLADARLTKVQGDVQKVYDEKLTTDQNLETMFNDASTALTNAHTANDNSKNIIINLYGDQTSSSTQQFMTNLSTTIATQKQAALIAASSSDPLIITPDSITNDDIETYVQNLIITSITNIKHAYDVFMTMSATVHKLLQ